MGILHLTYTQNAPCPILATFFCREGAKSRNPTCQVGKES